MKKTRQKHLKQRDPNLQETKSKPCNPPSGMLTDITSSGSALCSDCCVGRKMIEVFGLSSVRERAQQPPSVRPVSPPAEPPPKPSKRLIILAECKWQSDSERGLVLKELCERMAFDLLDKPFWIKSLLISPVGQTVEESGTNSCIQYKIHISRPKVEREKPAAPVRPAQGKQTQTKHQQVGENVSPSQAFIVKPQQEV